MRRWAFNILAGLSLGMLVAGIVLCIVGQGAYPHRSFTVLAWGDGVTATAYRVSVSGNGVSVQKYWGTRVIGPNPGGLIVSEDGLWGWDTWGFHYHRLVIVAKDFSWRPLPGTFGNKAEFWFEAYWWLLASALLPAWWLVRRLRHGTLPQQRAAHGLCPACGYDLRASFERCPECGTPIPGGIERPALK